MDSLLPFLWGSFIPYNIPVYPGALRFADDPVAIRKRYGVTEEISLSFLPARQASGLLV
jgi:hypothetical protein